MSLRVLLMLSLLAVVTGGCARGGGSETDAGTPPDDAGEPMGQDAGRPPAPDTGPPRLDAGVDAGGRDAGPQDGGSDAGGEDAGAPDAGEPDAGPDVCDPEPSTVIISEVMVASESGGGDFGEWFEIRNLSGCPIGLAGLVIEGTNGAGAVATHTIGRGLLTAGGVFLFAQSGDAAVNHGLSPDVVYGASGIAFSNAADRLTLRYSGAVIDQVVWGSTDHRSGAARQLDPSATASGTTIGGSDWCDATTVYASEGATSFRGTPGAANDDCS